MTPVGDRRVQERGAGADHAVLADRRAAADVGRRLDRGVLADDHVGVDRRAGRVDDRDAVAHQLLVDALLGVEPDGREVGAVVDAERLDRVVDDVGRDRVALVAEQRQHVGEVVLALRVVVLEALERLRERAGVEAEDPGVDLLDGELLGGRVAGRLRLHDALDVAVGVAYDAAVAASGRRAASSPSWPRPARGCALRRARRSPPAVISGTSPARMTTGTSGCRWPAAAFTASPVPFGSSWIATSTPGGRWSASARFGPSTTTIRLAPAARAAAIGHAISGRPHRGCSTFGVAERIRVPSPAARITTERSAMGAGG